MRRVLLLLLAAALCGAAAAQDDPRSVVRDGVNLLEEGRADQAETYFRRATAMAPTDPLPWAWEGQGLLVLGRHADAVDALQKALDLDDKTPGLGRPLRRETLDSLGLAWAFQKQFQKAREVFTRALESDPGYAVFRYNLACVCALDGDRAGALANLAQYLDRSRELPVGQLPIDASLDEDFKGLWGDPAFEGLLRERVGPQPDDTPASFLVRSGAGALGRGRTAEALERLGRAVKADPADPRAWFFWAGALTADGRTSEGGEAFGKALALSVAPRSWLTRSMVRTAALAAGQARLSAGDAKGALPLLERAWDLDPFRPAASYELARAKALLGDGPGALEALKRAQGQRENRLAVEPPLPEPASEAAFRAFRGQPGWEAIFTEAEAPAPAAPPASTP